MALNFSHKLSRSSWFNATVFGIGMASLFSDLSHETVTSLLPTMLLSMGVFAGALGTIDGVADGFSSLAKVYGGYWADRLHRRKPLCASGYGIMAAATAVIATALSWPTVLLGRVLAWSARGLRTPARKALLAEAVTRESYGRAFGFERAMDTTGAIIAPLMVLFLLKIGTPYRTLLWLSVIPAILAVFAILVFVRETPGRTPSKHAFLSSFRFLPKRFVRFLGAVGVFGAGDFAHSMLILYAISALTPSMGAANAMKISVGLYAFHNVIYAGISYPIGALADRHNKRWLLTFGYICGAVTALLLCFRVNSLWALAIVFGLAGAYVGIEETLEDSLASEILPGELRGTGFGTMSLINGLGDMISSISVGWLWAIYGPVPAFGFAFLLMVAGAGYLITMRSLDTA
jgi:MFS family permease